MGRLPRPSMAFAALNLALNLAAFGLFLDFKVFSPGPRWEIVVLRLVPAVWLLAAAWLARAEDSVASYAVSTACFVSAAMNGLWLWVVLADRNGSLNGLPPFLIVAHNNMTYSQLPVVLTAIVPAAVGWWQRRRERLADDPD
jgi:hypothetical protein